jgi:pectinesterase
MTIENAFDYPANAAKPDSDRTKFKNPQAVALMTDLGSDRAVFANVKITGYQDTLFPNSGRSYFSKCEVWGHVDFIFGAGRRFSTTVTSCRATAAARRPTDT